MKFSNESMRRNCDKFNFEALWVTRVRLDPWITNRIDSEFDLKLDPKIFKDTCARADHNQAEFLEQFTEATAMFNLLEASSAQPEKYLVE